MTSLEHRRVAGGHTRRVVPSSGSRFGPPGPALLGEKGPEVVRILPGTALLTAEQVARLIEARDAGR